MSPSCVIFDLANAFYLFLCLSLLCASCRFPAGLIGVAGSLPGSGAGVESLVAASLPMAHAITPVTQLPHTPSPGQPAKADSDRDNPSDQ